MTPEQRASLIEQVATAWRPRDRDGGAREHPVWHDLEADDRLTSFEIGTQLRMIEALLDPQGLSSTAHAVLRRIRREA